MAAYDSGYEDERFEHVVGQTLHCAICTNVLKNSVMCRDNEHLFCRACITRHLMNYQTCPSCMEPLTVETLKQAPRTVTNLLSELKIRCEFVDRGCGKFIELGDLERHVRECGFAPAVCSNEGCQLEVNKRDLLHHETAVCELRRVKCHSCHDIRQEMETVKVHLAAMNEKLDRNEKKLDENEKKFDKNEKKLSEKLQSNKDIMKAVEKKVVEEVKLVQEQLNKQEESNRQLKADNKEMKKCLNEITKQLERMTQQTSHEVQAEEEQMKKGIAEADDMNREPKVVIAGGGNGTELSSVEMFSLSTKTWTPLQTMKEHRQAATSVVYDSQTMVVMGGRSRRGPTSSMEKLTKKADEVNQSSAWETFEAELQGQLWGHRCVVYDRRLMVVGGYDARKGVCSDSVTEISLLPPYITTQLTKMPQARCLHGVCLFRDKIVIFGGREKGSDARTNLRTVFMYEITKKERKELKPLPYPVSDMATVKWGDNSIILLGGVDGNNEELDKVILYDVGTQESRVLPSMKHKRRGCVAAVVKDTVIVMGGKNKRGNCLKSVEMFRFDRNAWEELPEMHESRYQATAVAW